MAFYHFSKLEMYFATNNNPFDKFCLECVRKRLDLISDNAHAASFSIDPRFRDETLDIEHLPDIEAYFRCVCGSSWDERLRDQWVQFCTKA